MITIDVGTAVRSILDDPACRDLLRQALLEHLPRQRWFAAKDQTIAGVRLGRWAEFEQTDEPVLLAEIEVAFAAGAPQRYLLPLAIAWGDGQPAGRVPLAASTIAGVSRGLEMGVLYDATHSDDFMRGLLLAMASERSIPVGDSALRFSAGRGLQALDVAADGPVRRLGAEQSNSSALVGDGAMVKVYRRIESGVHPEVEIGRFLSDEAQFPHVPPWLGALEHGGTTYAAAFGFVANEGDGWRWTLDHLEATLAGEPGAAGDSSAGRHAAYVELAGLLGQRTAELHRAFAGDTADPAFAREPVGETDLAAWIGEARQQVDAGFATLAQARRSAPPAAVAEIDHVLTLRPRSRGHGRRLRRAGPRPDEDAPARRLPSGAGTDRRR